MNAFTAQSRLLNAIPDGVEISWEWKNNFPGKAMLHVQARKRTGEECSFSMHWPYRGFPLAKLKKVLLNDKNWVQP